jgi:hypothetical protein
MKTIIISDIDGSSESIIPYGLNIGKYTESEVDVIHILDPRTVQGVSSNVADSQTITPGTKLSHDEIMQKEKKRVNLKLDDLLSSEASRLNYPLKVNQVIIADTLEKGLASIFSKNDVTYLVCNSNPKETIFSDTDEMFTIINQFNPLTFLISPGEKFTPPGNVILLADFSENFNQKLKPIFHWLKPFMPVIGGCEVARNSKPSELKLNMKEWNQITARYSDSFLEFNTTVVQEKNICDNLMEFIHRSQPELIILPKHLDKSTPRIKLFSNNNVKKLMEEWHKPLLLY